MDGKQLYRLCKSICDDADVSFMTQSDWADALQQGYASFQQYVADKVPEIFEKQFDFAVPGVGALWSGTPNPGDTATLQVNALTYVYTVLTGDTMASVASALTSLATGNVAALVSNTGALTQVFPRAVGAAAVTTTYTRTGPSTGAVTQSALSQTDVNLDGVLFGATPALGKVAYRITKIHTLNVGQQPDFGLWLTPASTLEQLWAVPVGTGYGIWNPGKWCLQGTQLKFNLQQTNSFRLYYIPNGMSVAEWASAIVTPGSFIDNTPDFAQQLIAYFAVQAYNIKDVFANPVQDRKFSQLLQQTDRWLAKNRTGDASRWVQAGRQGPNAGFGGSGLW